VTFPLAPPTTPANSAPPALGWLLMLPALLGTLISLLLPTLQTLLLSVQSVGIAGPTSFVGLDNYGKVLGDGPFWRALAFTASLTVVPLLVAVVVGPLLALALDWPGGWLRRAGRVLLSLALVAFSPVAVAAGWINGLKVDPSSGDLMASGVGSLAEGLRDPATAPGALQLIIAAGTFGVVCALGTMAFLPALRGGTVSPAMLAVGGLVALATVAAGLQAFTMGLVLTNGGPNGSTQTLALAQYSYTFMMVRIGFGATVATVLGLVLGVLGIVAVCVAAGSGMRITVLPREAGGRRADAAKVVVGVLALVLVAALVLALTWPWLSVLFTGSTPSATAAHPVSGLRTALNTWVPALVGALVSVGVAYLAALGIGGLRPLGRRSEWLLLVFAPWLFVGLGPLSVADWRNIRSMGLIDTFVALIPPVLVSVPALLILTLLCKGLAERTGYDFMTGVVRPSLPMAGVLVLAVTLVNGQDLLWPLLVAQDPSLATGPVALYLQLNQFATLTPDVGLTAPLVVIVLALAGVVAAQLFYLDRLAITVGGSRKGVVAA
jgi:ABC-type sugar transport system permease subunit